MQREQMKYLLSRLSGCANEYRLDDSREDPKEVKAAHLVIERFSQRKEKESKEFRDALYKKANVAREAIYAGQYDKALSLVKEVEAVYEIRKNKLKAGVV